MRFSRRKTTPKVRNGKPLKKNNHKLTPNYWNSPQQDVLVDERNPGKDYKHFLKKRDVIQFISIIPNWSELTDQLDAIVLAPGNYYADGFYFYSGVVQINAWPKVQDIWVHPRYYEDHQSLFERLKIKSSRRNGGYFCEFNTDQIKAYQLLHILLHELGHHYDRITTKSKARSARGEDFAESFAFEYEEHIWYAYQDLFKVVF